MKQPTLITQHLHVQKVKESTPKAQLKKIYRMKANSSIYILHMIVPRYDRIYRGYFQRKNPFKTYDDSNLFHCQFAMNNITYTKSRFGYLCKGFRKYCAAVGWCSDTRLSGASTWVGKRFRKLPLAGGSGGPGVSAKESKHSITHSNNQKTSR